MSEYGFMKDGGKPPRYVKAKSVNLRVGQRFGNWVVLGCLERGKHALMLCRCDCGVEKGVRVSSLVADDVKHRSRSCGCIATEYWAKNRPDNTRLFVGFISESRWKMCFVWKIS